MLLQANLWTDIKARRWRRCSHGFRASQSIWKALRHVVWTELSISLPGPGVMLCSWNGHQLRLQLCPSLTLTLGIISRNEASPPTMNDIQTLPVRIERRPYVYTRTQVQTTDRAFALFRWILRVPSVNYVDWFKLKVSAIQIMMEWKCLMNHCWNPSSNKWQRGRVVSFNGSSQ